MLMQTPHKMTWTPSSDEAPLARLPERIKRGINAAAVHSLFYGMDALGLMNIPEQEQTQDLKVFRDLSYSQDYAQTRRLDVWAPKTQGPHPAVLFVHGGGFSMLSKDTHWIMARAFARRGFVVFNVDYRLAPEHAYPAPLQDVALALAWVKDNAARYGADLSRLVFCGESAGANLITALAVMTCQRFSEPWARAVYELNLRPKAIVPACGILQVTDVERLATGKLTDHVVLPQVKQASYSYLPQHEAHKAQSLLASPLLVMEQLKPTRELPAIFAPVGDKDPLRPDSLRLVKAAQRLGAIAQARTYAGGVHSFMAFMWTPLARQCWEDIFSFLDEHLSLTPPQELAPRRAA